MTLTTKQINNFFDKVEKTNSCWNWKGYTFNGYGKVNINHLVYNAHNIALLINGTEVERKKVAGSAGDIIMHTCDNRRCVNPEHLKVATQLENMRDAKNKGRNYANGNKGENNPKSKLSWDDIKLIRNTPSFKSSDFVRLYPSISRTNYYSIINNKTWATN